MQKINLNWFFRVLSISLCIWYFIDSKDSLFTILIIIPIIGLTLNGLRGKPSIEYLIWNSKSNEKGNWVDSVDYMLYIPIVLGYEIFSEFEYDSYLSRIIPFLVTCLFTTVLLLLTHRNVSSTDATFTYPVLGLTLAVYSFVAVCGLNCYYDRSEPEVYAVTIIDMKTQKVRERGHIIKVTSWPDHTEADEIAVPHDLFKQLEIGQK